jgi:cytochrome c oxidase assembly protein subunit 11
MTEETGRQQEKRQHLSRLLLLVAGMFAFGFARGPLYTTVCEATGVNGRFKNEVSAAKAGEVDVSRTVTVQFVTTVNGSPLWKFSPEQPSIQMHPGQMVTVSFYAENLQGQALVAQAVPNIAPGNAAPHLHKTECFCFTQQAFQANEKKHMPVRFFLDTDLPKGIDNVTLSYTLFDVTKMVQDAAGSRN